MRFIIHRYLNLKSSADSYNLGKVMLYYLNEKIHLSGIGEYNYFLIEFHEKLDIMIKLKILIDWSLNEEKERYQDAMASLKAYPKIKNKDSKLIVNYNKLKKALEIIFDHALVERYYHMNDAYDLQTFKDLVDYKTINFYHNTELQSIYSNAIVTPVTAILSLQLPEEDGECPILYLTNENNDGKTNLDLTVFLPDATEAEAMHNSYLTDVFRAPAIVRIPAAMMKSMASAFSKKSKPFNEKLHQWAKICYDNPDTPSGLTFFREQIVPLIEETKQIGFDCKVGKELLTSTIPGNFGFLQFGEMPVEKIWELMRANENCTEEDYQELLQLKETQSPKYNRRWPVVFFREEGKQKIRDEEELAKIPTTRKTLDID